MRISNIAIEFLKKLKEPIIKNEELLYSAKELDSTDFVAFWWDAFYFLNKSATASVQEFVLDLGRYYFEKPQDLSNVNLISSMIKRFESGYLRDTQKEPTLKDIIAYLDQVGRSRGIKYFEDGDVNISAVEILTIHKSKGDEFDAVFIPQFVDKYHKINPEKIELRRDDTMSIKLEKLSGRKVKTPEQKKKESAFEALRLIYVAITRAKKHLCFTSGSPKDGSEIFNLLQKLSEGVKV
jgi:ATP-dependent exoDNAse (exonuclease V) beta subunit